MILISHRGNIDGPNVKMENDPRYIENTLGKGYNVEVDVWSKGSDFFLGHDKPEHQVSEMFLRHGSIWCHAKDIKTFYKLIDIGAHCFSHDQDEVALTTKGYLYLIDSPRTDINYFTLLKFTYRSRTDSVGLNLLRIKGKMGELSLANVALFQQSYGREVLILNG